MHENKLVVVVELIYLQYEEAVKGREVFESNDYLLFAFMNRMMLTFNSPCNSNKIATSFHMWLIKRTTRTTSKIQ